MYVVFCTMSPDDVMERLLRHIEEQRPLTPFGQLRIDVPAAHLFRAKFLRVWPPVPAVLHGTVTSDDTGCRISIEARASLPARMLPLFVAAAVLMFLIVAGLAATPAGRSWGELAIVGIVACIPAAVLVVVRRISIAVGEIDDGRVAMEHLVDLLGRSKARYERIALGA